jgi:hypothetical protein
MSFDLSKLFTFGGHSNHVNSELPNIYPFGYRSEDFIKNDVLAIYSKILIDTLERTHGISEENHDFLWDNCLESSSNKGLISLLTEAMYNKTDLFLVYNVSLGVLRLADQAEKSQIMSDYKARGESAVGHFISFKQYKRTDMLKIYSAFEYGLISHLHKSISLSAAIQLKFSDMRASVGLIDSERAKAQAIAVATALSKGQDVAIDAKDVIESATPQIDNMKLGLEFLNQKRAFYLGMPQSYIEGTLQKGMGDSGHGDAKAVDRGLRGYFFSIIKPVVESIFNVDVTYKPNDTANIRDNLEVLKTFELTSDELLPQEEKQRIISSLFDFEV